MTCPALFRNIASSAGTVAPNVGSSTIGGYSLSQHLVEPGTLSAIDNGYGGSHLPWDFVVLQDISGYPAYAEWDLYTREEFQSSSVGLYDRVKVNNPNAMIVFFETPAWHQRMWTEADYPRPEAAGMQAQVRRWYAETAFIYVPANSASARKSDTMVAPVGDAWERNYTGPNSIMLHNPDYYHPLLEGAYLGSLVMYATMFDATPSGIDYTAGLSRSTADYLQQIAAMPVYHGPSLAVYS